MATRRKTTQKRRRKKSNANIWMNRQFHLFVGAMLLLISLLMVIAFTSYLFTWELDQSHFKPMSLSFIFSDAKVANSMGRFGSFVSHLSFHSFGLSSYIFALLTAIAGLRLMLPKKLFSFVTAAKYAFLALLIGTISLGFFFKGSAFSYGGVFGNSVSNSLVNFIGFYGTGILLIFGLTIFLIYSFNYNFDSFLNSIIRIFQFKKPAFSSRAKSATGKIGNPFSGFMDGLRSIKEMKGPAVSKPKKATSKTNMADKAFDEPEIDIEAVKKENINKSIEFEVKPGGKKEEPKIPNIKVGDASKTNVTAPIANKDDLIIDFGGEEDTSVDSTPSMLQDSLENDPTKAIIEQGDYDPTKDLSKYTLPPLNLLEYYGNDQLQVDRSELEKNKERIVETLLNYNIEIEKIRATPGPTITLYEIVPAPGVRISKIKSLVDDIALSLAALGIRIIAPIPGRGTIGIEIPNDNKKIVPLRELLASDIFQKTSMELPVAIGTGIRNKVFVADLTKMPHLLMAGATGQGKSVCINTLLVSLLYKKHPSEMKFVMIDPKKVELSIYDNIKRHFLASLPDEEDPIVTDTKKVIHTLNALCIEMDNRYNLLKAAQVRNIKEYNKKFIKRKLNPEKGHRFLPYFVLVIDEFADLIMTAGKEIEVPLTRLAQLARAVGIHLIIATQRPTVNIITGTIKANFPVRLAFRVSSKVDSRTIIDMGGAEQLIGRGDMILVQGADSFRLQGALVDTPEVERVTDFIGGQMGYPGPFELPEYVDEKDKKSGKMDMKRDKLFVDSARIVVGSQSGSTSLIQRKLSIGYNRAGRIMDQLEASGIVGAAQGSKPRDVFVHDLMTLEELFDANGWKDENA